MICGPGVDSPRVDQWHAVCQSSTRGFINFGLFFLKWSFFPNSSTSLYLRLLTVSIKLYFLLTLLFLFPVAFFSHFFYTKLTLPQHAMTYSQTHRIFSCTFSAIFIIDSINKNVFQGFSYKLYKRSCSGSYYKVWNYIKTCTIITS